MNRRRFLRTAATAGAAAWLGHRAPVAAAEAPLETTRIRLFQNPGICVAPQYIAEDLLKAEGFSDVEYVGVDATNKWSSETQRTWGSPIEMDDTVKRRSKLSRIQLGLQRIQLKLGEVGVFSRDLDIDALSRYYTHCLTECRSSQLEAGLGARHALPCRVEIAGTWTLPEKTESGVS